RGAVLRQAHRQRLNESSQILCVPWIAQPGKRICNCVEYCRSNNGRRQKRFERSTILQQNPDASDQSQRDITNKDLRVKQWRAVTQIYDRIRNEKRNEWH